MKFKINLLPHKEKKLIDKLIYFGLHYLRYVLVITQLIVIGVFFYRFKIDQEIIDLKEELTQKEEIVLVSEPLLKEAQAADLKIKEVRGIVTTQEKFKKPLEYFLSIFPEKMTLTQLKISNNSLNFNTVSADPAIIKLFLARLKKDNRFIKIEIGTIKRTEIGFSAPFKLEEFNN